MLPGVAGPRFIARFTRTGNGVEPPGFLPGCSIEGSDKSANAVFPARSTNDDLVLHHERSNRDRVTRRGIGAIDIHVPYGLSIAVSYTHLRAHETPEHL